jgi:hypothetical protein
MSDTANAGAWMIEQTTPGFVRLYLIWGYMDKLRGFRNMIHLAQNNIRDVPRSYL